MKTFFGNPPAACFGLVLAAALFLVGCPTVPRVVHLQPEFRAEVASAYHGATISVDLVGVNNSELAVWKAKPVDDYFAPGNVFRDSAQKVTLNFGGGGETTQRVSPSHPVWQDWRAKGATQVIVIADLPGYTLPIGGVDIRRQMIPLESTNWERSPEEVVIQITPTGIILVPAPKAS